MRPIFLPLPLLFLVACGGEFEPVVVSFEPRFNGISIDCSGTDVALNDLRLYVSEAAVTTSNGERIPVRLEQDPVFQNGNVAYVEMASDGRCDSETRNPEVRGSVPVGTYQRFSFTVGVPFERNHVNPLTAPPPLDDTAMHWHWRSGYKFLRAAIRKDGAIYWLHLGSTGCEGTVGDIAYCGRPNRVHVDIAVEDPAVIRVELDVGVLLGDMAAAPGGADCSSGPGESACSAPFAALGLMHGDDASAGPQRVFTELR